MSAFCSWPHRSDTLGRWCRSAGCVRASDGKTYCPHHYGTVKDQGSPYPVAVSS